MHSFISMGPSSKFLAMKLNALWHFCYYYTVFGNHQKCRIWVFEFSYFTQILSKCKRSSLRSQCCKMRLFSVIFKHRAMFVIIMVVGLIDFAFDSSRFFSIGSNLDTHLMYVCVLSLANCMLVQFLATFCKYNWRIRTDVRAQKMEIAWWVAAC